MATKVSTCRMVGRTFSYQGPFLLNPFQLWPWEQTSSQLLMLQNVTFWKIIQEGLVSSHASFGLLFDSSCTRLQLSPGALQCISDASQMCLTVLLNRKCRSRLSLKAGYALSPLPVLIFFFAWPMLCVKIAFKRCHRWHFAFRYLASGKWSDKRSLVRFL